MLLGEQRWSKATRRVTIMGSVEWMELDHLTARLGKLQGRREATPKGRIGWLREIDSQILTLEGQRERLVSHLTRQLLHRIAA
jgi:hypothetical protein